MSHTQPDPTPQKPTRYVPTVGKRLHVVLVMVIASAAILGATGAYLGVVSALEWWDPTKSFTTPFTFWMLLAHIGLGILSFIPFIVFGVGHYLQARGRPNRVAVRRGLMVVAAGAVVLLTGVALVQLEGLPQIPTGSVSRMVVIALHVLLPLAAVVMYIGHRKAGPKIRWKWGYAWAGATVGFVGLTAALHWLDPRDLHPTASLEGELYFHPSEARTPKANFIPADVLMMDKYCERCHADIYNDHLHSAHKFSSFNNPPYLFSVRETRKVALERDGDVKAARWCAGCHDPVPFFSGAFDDPKFDDVNHATAHAGITCTVCHAITDVHGPIGNAAFTIEEPQHYPFAQSDNPALQWINNQLVKAKPEFHKKTFLKPFHKTAEFCSTCHKVALPVALNHYKDFLRGQNHYDTFLLSGVSGHGARSFYYPPVAKEKCADCHMPLKASNDFGSKDFDGSGTRKVHNHFFPGGNTGLPYLLTLEPRYADQAAGFEKAIKTSTDFLRGTDPDGKDKKLRIDLFGLKPGGGTAAECLVGPLRPKLPTLEPGQKYLVEVVVRNLGVGHPFTQGTVDSNEVWVDFKAESGGQIIGRNGALQDDANQAGPADEWSHFINVLMLDRHGNRINRRNPQDIFTPLYDHQIPPGSAQVVHYRIDVPKDATEPVKLTAKLRYRKFDHEYMQLVHKDRDVPRLPIVDICEDEVTLPVEGGSDVAAQTSPIPTWQRWNDYGIACLLEGGVGAKKGHFKQAAAAFKKVTKYPEVAGQGHLNLARVYIEEGNFTDAAAELKAAAEADPRADWWSLSWFTTVVNSETAVNTEDLNKVILALEELTDPENQSENAKRKFDFSKDYVVLNKLANRLFNRAKAVQPWGSAAWRDYVRRAIKASNQTLALDPEDVEAHDLLKQCHAVLGNSFEVDKTGPESVDELARLGRTLADPEQRKETRLAAARRLAPGIEALGKLPSNPSLTRLGTYRGLVAGLNAAFMAETDDDVSRAISRVLTGVHLASHNAYKPDEIARSYARGKYGESHKAANYASRDRVIYPTTAEQRQAIIKYGSLPGSE